jgi:transcriptional regulator with XRE-family HTH domain
MEERTGFSKSSLHGWISGERSLDPARLDGLAEALGATHAERYEFAEALKRSVGLPCDTLHRSTGLRCVRNEFHTGDHRTARGVSWVDDGVLDGVIRDLSNPADSPRER